MHTHNVTRTHARTRTHSHTRAERSGAAGQEEGYTSSLVDRGVTEREIGFFIRP